MSIQVTNWLFVRGWMREQRHWGEFPQIFSESFNGINIHFLDLPGVGTEYHAECPLSVHEISRHLRNRWSSLKNHNDGHWMMLSISLGSMVGLEWTAKHPEDFKGHVLINTSSRNAAGVWDRLQFSNYPNIVRGFFEKDPIKRERLVLQLTTALQKDLDERAEKWAEIAKEKPLKISTVYRQLLAAARFKHPKKVSIPMLFLASANDRFVNPKCSLALARHYNAPLVVHPNAGHDIPLDDPKWVVDQIINWCR